MSAENQVSSRGEAAKSRRRPLGGVKPQRFSARSVLAVVAGAVMLLPACGQYDGVHDQFYADGGTNPGIEGSEEGGGAGSGSDGSGSGSGSGGSSGGDSSGNGSDGNGEGGGSSSGSGGGDTTGVTDDSITIGIHAPLTGAAPLRQDSFETGKDLYWNYGDGGDPVTVNGRTVEVAFADDRYRPSHARQVCQQMAEQDDAFLLIGGGGADQIQSCAQYAASDGIPYMSSGVSETGLSNLNNYFAASMTYRQQVPLLSDYIQNELGVTDASNVAAVVTNTPNFDDAAEGFEDAFPGVDMFRPDKNDRGSSAAGNLCAGSNNNYDVVFVLTAPTYYLELASAASCSPTYVGIGISMDVDQVASTGCSSGGSTEDARFFSPTPAFEDARQGEWDADFMEAASAAGMEPDDVLWMLWGQSKIIHQILEEAGEDLSRESFIATAENASINTDVFPELNYSPDNNFGASQVNVLRNVCESRGGESGYYVTDHSFVSGF